MGNPLGNAESKSQVPKDVGADLCAACRFFWKGISFVFLRISFVLLNIRTGFSL